MNGGKGMTTVNGLREHVITSLGKLPDEALKDVATFVDYLQYRLGQRPKEVPPFRPVALGGLWRGTIIEESDLAEVRREMWNTFGERLP
jgi:hypothetical protein